MGRRRLLGALCVSILIAVTLVSCQAESDPIPQPDNSPLASPVETPVPTSKPQSRSTPSACPEGCLEAVEGCLIKAVITGMGEWYYYLPGEEGYDDTIVLPHLRGRWFCNEEEANQGGYRKYSP